MLHTGKLRQQDTELPTPIVTIETHVDTELNNDWTHKSDLITYD